MSQPRDFGNHPIFVNSLIKPGFKFKNFIHLLKTASDFFSHLLKVLINLLISILKMNVEHLFSSYIVNEKI